MKISHYGAQRHKPKWVGQDVCLLLMNKKTLTTRCNHIGLHLLIFTFISFPVCMTISRFQFLLRSRSLVVWGVSLWQDRHPLQSLWHCETLLKDCTISWTSNCTIEWALMGCTERFCAYLQPSFVPWNNTLRLLRGRMYARSSCPTKPKSLTMSLLLKKSAGSCCKSECALRFIQQKSYKTQTWVIKCQ